jgi:drug/metabolite transporter (DMT)-like permease
MKQQLGVLAAALSSALGGMAAAATRFAISTTDPITLAALRFGLGFAFLLPLSLLLRSKWPRGRDWIGVGLLGLLFFAVFFVIYNAALSYTTAGRGSLALSTLPLMTMAAAAALGVEGMSTRKTVGVLIAMGGVAMALAAGLSNAPDGAWRGDLMMAGGTSCMALYNVWSRPFIARSSPLTFLTGGMGVGAICLALVAGWQGGLASAGGLGRAEWLAVLYLGLGGAAANFFLWVWALERTTPTRVASTITVSPVTAAIVAAGLLGEPVGLNLVLGVAAVCAGIWIASAEGRIRDG